MSIKLFEDREDDAEVDEDGGGCDGGDEITRWGNHRGQDCQKWSRWYRNIQNKEK